MRVIFALLTLLLTSALALASGFLIGCIALPSLAGYLLAGITGAVIGYCGSTYAINKWLS